MIVTATPNSDDSMAIEINGHTQGLLGGTLKKNVKGLRDYLVQALPELHQQYKQMLIADNHAQPRAGIGVAEEIERLSSLHKAGALSDTEYAQAKQKILSQ